MKRPKTTMSQLISNTFLPEAFNPRSFLHTEEINLFKTLLKRHRFNKLKQPPCGLNSCAYQNTQICLENFEDIYQKCMKHINISPIKLILMEHKIVAITVDKASFDALHTSSTRKQRTSRVTSASRWTHMICVTSSYVAHMILISPSVPELKTFHRTSWSHCEAGLMSFLDHFIIWNISMNIC